MKDINFFQPYLGRRKVKFNNRFILLSIFILLAVSISAYGIFNHIKIQGLTEEVVEYKALAEKPETVEKVNIIKAEREELEELEEEIESIRSLDSYVATKDVITPNYIKRIVSKKPDGLFLTSLSLDSRDVSMAGVSQDRLTIAEFAKGLESISDFEDVFVSGIRKEEIDYRFDITINDSVSSPEDEEAGEDYDAEEELEDEFFEEDEEE